MLTTATAEELADLAEIVKTLARDIGHRHSRDPEIVELNPVEHSVMRYVDRHPGTAPSEIARVLGVQRPNISAALRKLEEKGLIRRSADAEDGRGRLVTPTPRAAENLRRLRMVWSDALVPAAAEPDVADLTARLTVIHDLLTAARARADGAS